MPPKSAQRPLRPMARKFGLARKPRKPASPANTDDEQTTVWDIYNHHASTIDTELIKDWNDSLNTLLSSPFFQTTLYSAVVTAFIIESMKLLKENTTDLSRDILLVISKQLANSSAKAYEVETFSAPAYAVGVNCYFLTSISCSLIAALGAVLALEWSGRMTPACTSRRLRSELSNVTFGIRELRNGRWSR